MDTMVDRVWPAPVPAGEGLAPHLRLLSGQLADAVALVASSVASRADVDIAMRLGAGYPSGPFETLDGLGADATAFGRYPAPGPDTTVAPDSDAVDSAWRNSAGVIGTGHMATGIVEAIARSGRRVVAVARSVESVARLRAALGRSLDRSVAKGRLDAADAATVIAAVAVTTDPAALADVDVVIEAVAEDLTIKRELFAVLDSLLPPGLPLASNTSSFRIGEIAAGVRPERPVLGLHFFNPAPAMKLVEVIVPPDRAIEPVQAAESWVRSLGKTPVRCADSRGFIVNRLLIPFLNDAVRAHEAGLPVVDADALMVDQAAHPMGPFALLDLIGLDITAAALTAIAESDPDPRLVPADTLRDLVARGRLGRKTGHGFHDHGAAR